MKLFPMRAAVAASVIVAGLSACQMQGGPVASAPRAPQAVIMPTTGGPAEFSDETTTQTRSVSEDGLTVRTETRSARVSVNGDAALAGLFGAAGRPAATAADYAGTWRVTNAENRECRLTLRAAAAGGAAQVSNAGCFGQPLFSVNRWSLRGSDLVLTDAFNSPLVSLRATGPNRLEGGGVVMFR